MKENNMTEDNVQVARGYTEWIMKTGGFARDKTLRDYFAGIALPQAIKEIEEAETYNIKEIAEIAYQYADAMLKERNK